MKDTTLKIWHAWNGAVKRRLKEVHIRHMFQSNTNIYYTKLCSHVFTVKPSGNENKIISQIKEKLMKDKAMITKADKANTIVVLYIGDYSSKDNTFISNNNFTQAAHDITKKLRDVRITVNECQHIIEKEGRWKFINLNPTAPNIRGLVKINKEGALVRPIINWKNSPA